MKGLSSFKRMLEKYHAAMHHLFSKYGSFVAHYPFIPLLIGVILLGSLCIGILRAEKENAIENLWVEQNSRIVPEKKFFDAHFGGISRKESVIINSKEPQDAYLHDLGRAMDALTSVIKPLYDEITLNLTINSKHMQLNQSDFCERPLVPTTLRTGSDPNVHGNWYAWGYRFVSDCALDTLQQLFTYNRSEYGLPRDWGLDVLPCYKLTPMDCFQEGNEFDYPKALQQLEQLVVLNATLNGTLNQIVLGFERLSGQLCFGKLESNLKTNPKSIGVNVTLTSDQTTNILAGVKSLISVLASWGYSWRPSYKNMTSDQILNHINRAIQFSKNASLSLNNPEIQYCISEKRPCCMTWFGAPVPVEASLGNVVYNKFGEISAVGAMRWGANHWNNNHPLWVDYLEKRLNVSYTAEERMNLVLSWEDLMIRTIHPSQQNRIGTNFSSGGDYNELQVQFATWKSSEDVLTDANRTPVWQIIFSAVLVCSYACAVFVNLKNPVHSHTWLVLMGMAVVSFAIISGFGLTSAFGIKFSPLAGSIVPFLALGLGIDDVFVLVNTLRNFLKDQRIQALYSRNSVIPENELRLTVALAGPSVVLTTFSILAAFLISSVNPIPMVRWFCWQMGITAFLHTCGMLLIFIPVMSLDARRVKEGVVDPGLWLFCGRRRAKELTASSENYSIEDPSSQEHTANTPVSIAIAKFYAPLFRSNLFKVSVTLLFGAFLGWTIYLGFWKVQHGLSLSEITLKGSYQHEFAELTDKSFPQYDLYLVTQNIQDYSKEQDNLLELYNTTLQNISQFMPSQSKILDLSWLGNLYTAVNFALDLPYPFSPQNFSQLSQFWSTSPLGMLSLQDLSCKNSITQQQTSCFVEKQTEDWSIGATKTVVFADNLGADTKRNVEMIMQTRESVDHLNKFYFNGTKIAYMYGYPFLFYEQYLHSSHDLYMVVGFALVGVFLAVLIFQFSITMSLIITIILLMVDIEVYGSLYIIGAKLNALSLVNLGIVIGMASEFTYLARSFLLVKGTRSHRIGKALEWTFEPLLHGLGTQVVAMLPLLFLKYHAFRIYYFGMFTIMGILGFLNGFVLLPVFLSWFGPSPLPHIEQSTDFSNIDDGDQEVDKPNDDKETETHEGLHIENNQNIA